VFRILFNRDRSGRLGTTTVAWLVLLFSIFFSGHMWNRQMTSRSAERASPSTSDCLAIFGRLNFRGLLV